jgi:hypothetical protein
MSRGYLVIEEWNWKKFLSDKFGTQENLMQDCLSGSSIFFELCKNDVLKIIRAQENYKFIYELNYFDDLYFLAVEDTKKQLKRVQERKSFFVHCGMEINTIFQKLIARIVNNMKNLFDERYQGNIQKYLQTSHIDLDSMYETQDAFMILLEEEVEKFIKETNPLVIAKNLREKVRSIRYQTNNLVNKLLLKARELENNLEINID